MANYRLEIWFDFTKEKVDWGLAQTTNTTDTTPFQSGGTAVNKNSGKVIVAQGASQPFDIYLFDNTGNDVQRMLQWFAIDYEVAQTPAPGQTGRDPVGVAETLRAGVTGDTFMGSGSGGANGTTAAVGQENNIVCKGNALANRRWSLSQGYGQALTSGNYSFTIAFVIGSPTEKMVKGFTVDPEMDIQS